MKRFQKFFCLCFSLSLVFVTVSCSEVGSSVSSSSTTSSISQERIFKILDEGPLQLEVGDTYQLNLDIRNIAAETTFFSENPEIVIVSAQGLITAVKNGSTTIRAQAANFSDSIVINVGQQDINVESLVLSASAYQLAVNQTAELKARMSQTFYVDEVNYEILEGDDVISINGSEITAESYGVARIIAHYEDYSSNEITINVYDFLIDIANTTIEVDDYERLSVRFISPNQITAHIENPEVISIGESGVGDLFVNGLSEGTSELYFEGDDGLLSNALYITIIGGNPYISISEREFYANYTPTNSYLDAQYRSECYLMSGELEVPDEAPTISSYRPREGDYLVHNNQGDFSRDGNTYYVYDAYGQLAFEVYRGGAYITLEEVAAYIYAFGDVPANYERRTKTKPYESEWGEYLRVNNNEFSGDTSDYRYEPELPRISGCDGDLYYYEIDIGTTGTWCAPNRYPPTLYNDGDTITRGAARIVYSRYYSDGTPITELSDRYVFYTYNHYNDFQEYLNYENGWGDIFGNVTAGASYNEYDPNNPPTPYIETIRDIL